jgi:Fe-S cluster assembly iron-binding protein IscA
MAGGKAHSLVTVTEGAWAEFQRLGALPENAGRRFRIRFAGFGCSGPRIGLAGEAIVEGETVFDRDGVVLQAGEDVVQYLREKQGLTLDYHPAALQRMGFSVTFGDEDG